MRNFLPNVDPFRQSGAVAAGITNVDLPSIELQGAGGVAWLVSVASTANTGVLALVAQGRDSTGDSWVDLTGATVTHTSASSETGGVARPHRTAARVVTLDTILLESTSSTQPLPMIGAWRLRRPIRSGNCRLAPPMSDLTPKIDHLASLDARIQATEIAADKLRSMVAERRARGVNSTGAFQALIEVEAQLERYRGQRGKLAQLLVDIDAGRG